MHHWDMPKKASEPVPTWQVPYQEWQETTKELKNLIGRLSSSQVTPEIQRAALALIAALRATRGV